MADDPKKGAEDGADDLDARIAAAIDARLSTTLNSAITTHLKRHTTSMEKTIADSIAKALEANRGADQGQQTQPRGATEQASQRTDPELAKLRETVEKLSKQAADADAARIKAEQKAARDATHTQLREHLDGLGIKGARARAVIADLEASGALRVDEESGAYVLGVKRARSKGARPEELVFDDFAAALKDWSQTDDAKEFLPAQTATQTPSRRAPGSLPMRAQEAQSGTSQRAPQTTAVLNNLGLSEADLFGD